MGVELPSDVGIGDALPAELSDSYENSPKFLREKVTEAEIPLLDTPVKAKDSSNGIRMEPKMDAAGDEQAIVENHAVNEEICTGIEENGRCDEVIDERIEEDANLDNEELDNGRDDGRSAVEMLQFGNEVTDERIEEDANLDKGRDDGRSAVEMLQFGTIAAADMTLLDNDDKHGSSKSEEELGSTEGGIEDSDRNDSSDGLVSSTLEEVGNSFSIDDAGTGNGSGLVSSTLEEVGGNGGNDSSDGLVSSTVSVLNDQNTGSEGTSDSLENDKYRVSSSKSDTEEIGNIGSELREDGGHEQSVGGTDNPPSNADEKSVEVDSHAPESVSGSIDESCAQSLLEVVDPDHMCSETSDMPTSSNDGSSPKTETRSSDNPFPKRHTFYLVRIPYIEDHLEKTLKQEMEMRVQKYTAERDSIAAASKLKKAAKDEAYKKLESARKDEEKYLGPLSKNDEELKNLQFDLYLLDEAKRTEDRRNELSQKIAELEYQIQHESISLSFEKKLLQEIKKLKTARDKIPVHKKQDDPQQRKNISERIKVLDEEYASLRKESKPLESKTRSFLSEYEALRSTLKKLSADWEAANGRRQEAYRELRNLLDKEAARNTEFHQCRKERQLAKQFAFNNEKSKLENISKSQVERVLARWNSDAEFRSSYVTYNQASTLRRLQTLDGRSLGPNEVPPSLISENLSPVVSNGQEILNCPKALPKELCPAEVDTKQKSPAVEGPTPSTGIEKEIVDKPNATMIKNAPGNRKTTAEVIAYEEPMPFESIEGSGSGKTEYDEEEQREKHRQEEMAKAKEAANRKRKLAERSQARALARAQKDAERRQKEKEKVARKKAAAAALVESPPSSNGQASENEDKKPDEADELPKAAPQARKRSALQKGRKTADAPKVIPPPRRNGRIQIWTKLKGSMSWLLLAGLSLFIVISVVAMSLQNFKAGVA